MDAVTALLDAAIEFGAANPKAALAAIGALAALLLVNNVRGPAPLWRDPQRIFTADQRRLIHERAGGRCEHKSMAWLRCGRAGVQADHVFPWSKGGPTTLGNAQSLCQPHNRSKTNSTPSRLYVWRLERRRRRYFPAGTDPRVTTAGRAVAPPVWAR